MYKIRFLICKKCGNLVGLIDDKGPQMTCCGEPMTELVPNTTDAAKEKHVPVVKVEGNLVTVDIGSAPHPMTDEHHIAWVYVHTCCGGHRRALSPSGKSQTVIALAPDEHAKTVYAYCNLHCLWMTEV